LNCQNPALKRTVDELDAGAAGLLDTVIMGGLEPQIGFFLTKQSLARDAIDDR
jgi:hypothetical protein